ncbi:uncharacterized protein LOC103314011 [Tribolium castaneum]|uniref:Uncharacterized protein n=1 Tax=Tribolium castaneum TaxID=7070 RepID=A0A139WDN6_TRICA|nr:PREDICTED: uncharacterized protein LOC103314011 [Tribolium castaneum]XP_008196936.1 PREDICTED: uncharacterized protein LOC103314011 [Tribolium castaneum]KYB25951.1 hypothetical protein TcasGA2_TC034119 [Tribolium castaneum]|eukprot:XP_008196935.1 PREDICTED: uncharacterized protein LOC103314011 [Tribolium castaneum]
MDVIFLYFAFFYFYTCQSASLHKKNETLEILKKDVSQVGSAIENFTFDILGELLDDSEDQETTTIESVRSKRSVEDDVRELCHKRCQKAQEVETQQIKDLTVEVKKLKQLVKLLQDQQKIIEVLEQKNNTGKEAKEEKVEENVPNHEQLAKIKTDLTEVIKDLNETRELIDLQKQKDEILEEELMRQKDEITKLKSIVEKIVQKNETIDDSPHISARASELTNIRKFLKSLPDDDDDEDDIHAKLIQLEKQIKKKRRQESLFTELKNLEKNLDEDNGDSDLLKQIIKALKKSEPERKSDSLEITNLSDLEEAINRLRPKESDSAQFQSVLTKLINKPQTPITITPQQMSELTKKLAPNNRPYICIADDGAKNNGYAVPYSRNFPFYPPLDHNQFFPGQVAPPNYYTPGSANGVGSEKQFGYQANGDKYQEDLKQQIDGLQAAIDSLNRPEYLQRPEDKAIVDDLERQIGDLRSLVTNLNYEGVRAKRSTENNEVEEKNSEELIKEMSHFVNKLFKENNATSQARQFGEIQDKINSIKKELDGGKSRAANDYAPPSFSELLNPLPKEVKSSVKNDFFTDVIGRILDKLISAIPIVIQKLFNFSLDELSKNDYSDYDVQVLYKNLGIFAYLPVIILRLVKGISAFMNMLRKNSFFKNFLMPAIILATVAGAVIFLIWWLQPDTSNNPYGYISDNSDPNYQYAGNYQYSGNNQYPVSTNSPVYSRSYFNK